MATPKRRVLVIDDQIGKPGSREMRDFLLDYKSLTDRYEFLFEDCEDVNGRFSSEEAVQAVFEAGNIDLVLLDVKFGSESDRLGFEILERIRSQFRALPVMMMTSLERDGENLARSLEPGAVSYISKRPSPEEFVHHMDDAIAIARDYAILGNSGVIRALRKEIARVCPYGNVPIMILGERGTGKERVARYIHQNGPRRDCPFVGLNCAGLSAELLEAELFGYTKGAFTGAEKDRKGYLEVAEGGTLFLDEMGEIPIRVQVSLLRVLEERKFRPVGGADREVAMDVQIISATNADIRKLIDSGKLREDFHDRIAAFIIETPPLREYRDDVPELATYFLKQLAPAQKKKFSNQALTLLKAHDWPGNGRELRNVVWRSVIKSGETPVVDADCLPKEFQVTKPQERLREKVQISGSALSDDFPSEAHKRADYLSRLILQVIVRETADASGNSAAVMRDLFPGQAESKRYLGQVAWKLVDWNPRLLGDPSLLELFRGCEALWSAFVLYMSANPMTRRKLWDKLQRMGISTPELAELAKPT